MRRYNKTRDNLTPPAGESRENSKTFTKRESLTKQTKKTRTVKKIEKTREYSRMAARSCSVSLGRAISLLRPAAWASLERCSSLLGQRDVRQNYSNGLCSGRASLRTPGFVRPRSKHGYVRVQTTGSAVRKTNLRR